MILIPQLIAHGYGISFRDIENTTVNGEPAITFPKDLKRGDLCFFLEESNGLIFPGIKIGNEVTICLAFYVYIPDVGWRMIDLISMPHTVDRLLATGGNLEFNTLEPNMDMSQYEIVSIDGVV